MKCLQIVVNVLCRARCAPFVCQLRAPAHRGRLEIELSVFLGISSLGRLRNLKGRHSVERLCVVTVLISWLIRDFEYPSARRYSLTSCSESRSAIQSRTWCKGLCTLLKGVCSGLPFSRVVTCCALVETSSVLHLSLNQAQSSATHCCAPVLAVAVARVLGTQPRGCRPALLKVLGCFLYRCWLALLKVLGSLSRCGWDALSSKVLRSSIFLFLFFFCQRRLVAMIF